MKAFDQEILEQLEALIENNEMKTMVRRAEGQTDTAVKIVHEPTGIEAMCDNYESQIKNKAICLILISKALKARIR